MSEPTKYQGVPFFGFTSKGGSNAGGIRASIFWEEHEDSNYKGALIGGLYAGVTRGDLAGTAIGGLGSTVEGNQKGIAIGGLVTHVGGNFEGIAIGGLVNYVGGKLEGLAASSIGNEAVINGKLAVQIGTCNKIRGYNEEGTTIQLGLYNRSGAQTIPLVNIRGIKNLFKRNKKTGVKK